jgi:phosphatidylglycerophosphatase A
MLGDAWLLFVMTVVVFVAGVWAAEAFEQASDDKDPGSVVIDEVAGQWFTLLFVPVTPLGFFVAFGAFRLFDISKVWPIFLADQKLSGGFGIMADDIVAAIYAGILSAIILAIF